LLTVVVAIGEFAGLIAAVAAVSVVASDRTVRVIWHLPPWLSLKLKECDPFSNHMSISAILPSGSGSPTINIARCVFLLNVLVSDLGQARSISKACGGEVETDRDGVRFGQITFLSWSVAVKET